jgi:hypothetical protein
MRYKGYHGVIMYITLRYVMISAIGWAIAGGSGGLLRNVMDGVGLAGLAGLAGLVGLVGLGNEIKMSGYFSMLSKSVILRRSLIPGARN